MSKHFHKSAAITSDFPSFDEFSAAYDVLKLNEDYDWYAEDAADFVEGFNEMTPNEKYKAVTDLASAKVQDYYDQLVGFYEGMTFPATLYRVVHLSKIEALNMDNIGESWTWDEHSAEEFLPGNVGRFILKANVPYESVDWPETLKLNLDRGIGEVENEVRLKFDAPLELVAYRSKSTKEWTPIAKMVTANNKTAYLSPSTGALDISIIRDSRPYVSILLDLGIPNFTVFSLKFPLVEDSPTSMSTVIAEAVHTLLDEMSTFMISAGFEHNTIVKIYAIILTAFKGMTGEADTNKSSDAIGKDPVVKTFAGSFKLPMDFINETYDKVVTAAGKTIKRPPTQRHLELTYEKPSRPTVDDARKVIRNFKNRSIKTQPSPMYILVYDTFGNPKGSIPVGGQFKNQLLNMMYKKKAGKEPEFTPTIKFDNDIEMKTTNAKGIPKSVLVGDEEYTPYAYIGNDMALFSSEKGEWIVKFSDGRCVPFADFPSVDELKEGNYPVPTEYTNWTVLQSTPEASDKSEAVDEQGNEVVDEVETESNPITDLTPDDEKNEQLEEGKDIEESSKTGAFKNHLLSKKASYQECYHVTDRVAVLPDIVKPSKKKKSDHMDENGYWAGAGGGASGILPICITTGRICLAWRSAEVHQGNCWGTIGGAIQRGMSASESARAELMEETGYKGNIRLIPAFVFTDESFKYHNFIGLVPTEFGLNPMDGGHNNLQFNEETDALEWLSWEEVQDELGSCHPGLVELLNQSGDKIRQICEAAGNKEKGN